MPLRHATGRFVLSGDPAAQREWSTTLAGSVPGLQAVIGDNLGTLIDARTGAGIIGLVGLFLTGTAATEAAGYAVGQVFRVPLFQSFFQKKRWSIATTAGLGLLALSATAAVGIAAALEVAGPLGVAVKVLAALVAVVLDFGLFLLAYRVLVQRRGPPFSQLWQGALLAAVGWAGLKLAGAWYAARTIASSSAAFGAFASTAGVLVILNLASRVFLYGAELNAVLIEKHGENDGAARGPLRRKGMRAGPADDLAEGQREPGGATLRTPVERVGPVGALSLAGGAH